MVLHRMMSLWEGEREGVGREEGAGNCKVMFGCNNDCGTLLTKDARCPVMLRTLLHSNKLLLVRQAFIWSVGHSFIWRYNNVSLELNAVLQRTTKYFCMVLMSVECSRNVFALCHCQHFDRNQHPHGRIIQEGVNLQNDELQRCGQVWGSQTGQGGHPGPAAAQLSPPLYIQGGGGGAGRDYWNLTGKKCCWQY